MKLQNQSYQKLNLEVSYKKRAYNTSATPQAFTNPKNTFQKCQETRNVQRQSRQRFLATCHFGLADQRKTKNKPNEAKKFNLWD